MYLLGEEREREKREEEKRRVHVRIAQVRKMSCGKVVKCRVEYRDREKK